jgi:hypothetical protein
MYTTGAPSWSSSAETLTIIAPMGLPLITSVTTTGV